MKNILVVMILAFTCHISVSAQKLSADKVPAAVKAAFKTKFPTATSASWELESKDVYEVNFTNNKVKQSAQFDAAGKWEKTEVQIASSELPKAVADAFAKAFPGYKITEAERAETPSSKLFYELEAAKGADKVEVQLLPNGEILKREKISAKD